MREKYLFVALLSGLCFTGSLFAGKSFVQIPEKGVHDSMTEENKKRFELKGASPSRETGMHKQLDPYKGEAYFFHKLQANPNLDSLFQLLDEALEIRPRGYGGMSESFELLLILKKLGETAPLQGLHRLSSIKGHETLMGPLLAGWASKDPEAAIKYYEDHKNGFPEKQQAWLLKEILKEYAQLDPGKALKYLNLRSESFKPYESVMLRNQIVRSICWNHPELIPRYINELNLAEEKTNNEDYLFLLGKAWGEHTQSSSEWLNDLPPRNKLLAESGRIMGITEGKIDEIDKELSQFSDQDQITIKENISIRLLFNGGKNMEERATWIIDFWPESSMSRIELPIKMWMAEDTRAAKKWINLLPAGKKKEMLEKWCGEGTRI